MKFDDIISELGEFGPYQKRVYYLACLVTIPAGLQTLIGVFIMATPAHRCVLPELPNDTYTSQGAWHKDLVGQSVPWDKEEEDFSSCFLFSNNATTGHVTNDTHSCSQWVYSDQAVESTFATETDMVCEDAILSTYANMILMTGFLTGSLIFGPLSDVIGRKKVLVIGILGHFSSSFGVAFVSSYVAFVILRCLTLAFGVGMFLSAFVIGMEIVGPSRRRFAGIVFEMVYCLGVFFLAFLAYFIREWRYLQIAASLPELLTSLPLIFFLPESPRWLIQKGRYDEALKIIRRAAKSNGVELSDDLLNFEKFEDEAPDEKIWFMFKNPVLLVRCVVIFFNWFVASLVYYGLSLNVGALSGDIHLNFTLYAAVEMVSYFLCLAFLDRVGRKPLHCFSMVLAGLACLGMIFPVMFGDDTVDWVTVTLSLVGKFGASAAFAIVFIFTAELFPTAMRNSAMGLSSFSARLGGIVAPYIADLGKFVSGWMGVALPSIIFGVAPIAAAVLALLLPETRDRILPDSVEEAKTFAKKEKKKGYELCNSSKDVTVCHKT